MYSTADSDRSKFRVNNYRNGIPNWGILLYTIVLSQLFCVSAFYNSIEILTGTERGAGAQSN
jgi:hypothetical protein